MHCTSGRRISVEFSQRAQFFQMSRSPLVRTELNAGGRITPRKIGLCSVNVIAGLNATIMMSGVSRRSKVKVQRWRSWLKPEQEQIIQAEIASGRFRNPEEVVAHALAALRDKSDERKPDHRKKNLAQFVMDST
jgi:hypothetical protein